MGSNLSSGEIKETRERRSVGWATERNGHVALHFRKATEEGALGSEKNHPGPFLKGGRGEGGAAGQSADIGAHTE